MKLFVVAAVWILVAAPAAPRAYAQAWARERGTGVLTVAVQDIENTGHRQTDGSTAVSPGGDPVGLSRTAAVYFEVEYALTDSVSFTLGLPYVLAKYLGPRPPPGAPEPPMVRDVDRCYCWQHAWQDVGGAVRFNVLNGATAVTPSVSFGVPSHGYEHVGEAVVGRHLREVRLALDVGQRLDWLTPRLAVQGRYSYAFVERVLDVPNNRSNFTAEMLLDVSEHFSVRGALHRQVTHGGLRLGAAGPTLPDGYPWGEAATKALFDEHDRLMRDNHWRLGAGLSYQLPWGDVFASYLEFVAGTDTHAGRAFTAGFSVPFGRRQP